MEILEGRYRVFGNELLKRHRDNEIREFFRQQSPVESIGEEDIRQYLLLTLMPIFDKLPDLSRGMLDIYKTTLDEFRLSAGHMKIYAVGGRVKGTPLKVGSDIDIVFAAQKPNQMIEQPEGVWSAQAHWAHEIDVLQSELIGKFREKCAQSDVSYKFHIVNFGSPLIQSQNAANPYYLLAEK